MLQWWKLTQLYLKKIEQKVYKSHDTPDDFCWCQQFFTRIQQLLLYQEIQIMVYILIYILSYTFNIQTSPFMFLVFYWFTTWRKIHNLVIKFRTKSFYHLDIGTLFSIKNTKGSKLVTVLLTVSIYYQILFILLLADWSKVFF